MDESVKIVRTNANIPSISIYFISVLILPLPPRHTTLMAESPDSSKDSNEEEEKDSKSSDDSDSSDDTFVKDTYLNSSSVWRSYTTRGQAKGTKEGELSRRFFAMILPLSHFHVDVSCCNTFICPSGTNKVPIYHLSIYLSIFCKDTQRQAWLTLQFLSNCSKACVCYPFFTQAV